MRKLLGASGGILWASLVVAGAVNGFRPSHDPQASAATAANGWTFAAKMPHRRSYTAAAEVSGKIYVAAGMVGNTGRPLDLLERFDPERNEWRSLAPLPESFSAAAATDAGEQVYVIGGNTGKAHDRSGRQVFAYDTRRGTWARKAPLPAIRTNHAAVTLGAKIYAIGGLDPVEPTRTVFSYDLGKNRWSRVAPLPRALHAHAAVAFKGKIWVLGGRERDGTVTRRVWIYDPRLDRWHAGPTMPEPMEIMGATVVGDRIYAVFESITLVYDARTSHWSRGPSLQVPRHALALFYVGGRLYAIGGCIVPQLEDSQVVETLALSP